MVKRYEPDFAFDATKPLARSTQGAVGADRMAVGLSSVPNKLIGDLKEVQAHLSGTGHATLAEMRREFDDIKARLKAIMPVFQEARDAITALTTTQCALHNVSLSLADRMDAVGIKARWDAARPKEPT